MSTEKKPVSLAARRRKKIAVKCPMCGRPTEETFTPFCSKRCADADLAKWLSGDYKIPTSEKPDEGATPPDDEE